MPRTKSMSFSLPAANFAYAKSSGESPYITAPFIAGVAVFRNRDSQPLASVALFGPDSMRIDMESLMEWSDLPEILIDQIRHLRV